MTKRIYHCCCILLLALSGCHFGPEATSKTVTTNDVVGVWSLAEDYGKRTVTMTFTPAGVFTQQVATANQTNIQVGKWSLDGSHLHLEDFLASVGNQPTTMNWFFVDGDKRLEIFGGSFPDPDDFQHLKYLGPTP
jgi:hypothetical protein